MSRNRRTRLQLTPLECRMNPGVLNYSLATDSFVSNRGDVNLYVTFVGMNSISWTTNPMSAGSSSGTDYLNTGNLRINLASFAPPSGPGNLVSVDLGGQMLTGNLRINLSAYNDRVYIYNGAICGHLYIDTKKGDDSIVLGTGVTGSGSVKVVGNLRIYQGDGDDVISTTAPLTVNGNSTIAMGAGNNGYNLATPMQLQGDLLVQGGNGDDPVGQLAAPGSKIGGNVRLALGNGNNSISLPAGLTINGRVRYAGGSGIDDVFDNAAILGAISVMLGASNDTFTFGNSHSVGGMIRINGRSPLGTPGDVYVGPLYPGVVGFP